MTTVFISYRHESQVHRNRVRELALRLRNEGRNAGLRVILDQLVNEEEFHRGGPHEGWGIWSAAQADKADRVLIVASAGWFRCFRREERAGEGLGAASEASVIHRRLYEQAGTIRDIRIVFFESGDVAAIPRELRDYHRFDAMKDFADLLTWLTEGRRPALRQPEAPSPITTPPSRERAPSLLEELGLPIQKVRMEFAHKILLTTIGAKARLNPPISEALDAVRNELKSRDIEVAEFDDISSIAPFELRGGPLYSELRYWAFIALVGSDLGVERTKKIIADFRRSQGKEAPPMYFFNFSTFPLHQAVIWTTAVHTVDDLLDQVRQRVLRFML